MSPEKALEQIELSEEKIDLRDYLARLEIALISQALKKHEGVIAHAARELSLNRTTLLHKVHKYNIHREAVYQG